MHMHLEKKAPDGTTWSLRIPLPILAQEFEMMSNKRRATCQAFAAGMLELSEQAIFDNPVNTYLNSTLSVGTVVKGVRGGDFREIAIEALAKRRERITRQQFIDPYGDSIKKRGLSGNVIAKRAVATLDTCTYRTTTTYQHTVVLMPTTFGKTSFKGKGSELTPSVKKNKKNCFIKRHSVITITLNLAKWSKVLRFCPGFVDEYSGGNYLRHFIYELAKVKSENELYVYIMKQASGYGLRSARAIIRRGHDGVWRIHDWPRAWP